MNRILKDREERYYKTLEMLKEYKYPVVCAKINYPGQDKNTTEAVKAFEILQENVLKEFEGFIIKRSTDEGFDGRAELIIVNLEGERAKEISVELEEGHRLGRIFDVDVYVEGGNSLLRTDMGKGTRKCIVCGEDARMCIRGGRHSLSEVVDCVNKLINECE